MMGIPFGWWCVDACMLGALDVLVLDVTQPEQLFDRAIGALKHPVGELLLSLSHHVPSVLFE